MYIYYIQSPGNAFSKVLHIVALCMNYTRALIFQNVCGALGQRLPPGEFVPIPRTFLAQLLRRPRQGAFPPRRLAPPVSGTVSQKSSWYWLCWVKHTRLTFEFFFYRSCLTADCGIPSQKSSVREFSRANLSRALTFEFFFLCQASRVPRPFTFWHRCVGWLFEARPRTRKSPLSSGFM